MEIKTENRKVLITETILRDAHQSQAATRMRLDEMLPVLEQLDDIGYYSLEAWGGATFDSCLRFLNEDPWERLRILKSHLKKTPIQMLLRGQNLLGYRHYADDLVEKFVEKSIGNGVGVVRVFDALNDPRNLETSMKAIKKYGGVAVVAHPVYIPKDKLELLVAGLVPYGLDGLECYYSTFNETDTKRFLNLAAKYNLITTAGTDLHDANLYVSPTYDCTRVDMRSLKKLGL